MRGWRRATRRSERAGLAVGDAVAEHADVRHRARVLRELCLVEGTEAVRGARHDAAVRARRRAVDRRPTGWRRTSPRWDLPGALFRPVVFTPTFQKHAGKPCGGCQVTRPRSAGLPARPHRTWRSSTRCAPPIRPALRGSRRPTNTSATSSPMDVIAGSTVVSRGDRQRRARRGDRGGMARQRRRVRGGCATRS